MNGRAQFWMNIGLTLTLGVYGLAGAIYSEFLKPDQERNGWAIAIDVFLALAFTVASIIALKTALQIFENNPE